MMAFKVITFFSVLSEAAASMPRRLGSAHSVSCMGGRFRSCKECDADWCIASFPDEECKFENGVCTEKEAAKKKDNHNQKCTKKGYKKFLKAMNISGLKLIQCKDNAPSCKIKCKPGLVGGSSKIKCTPAPQHGHEPLYESGVSFICKKGHTESANFKKIGDSNKKCCINGVVPKHNWIAGVNTQPECEARCNNATYCTGFTYSGSGCLLWKEPLSPTETIDAPGYAGCWHKKNTDHPDCKNKWARCSTPWWKKQCPVKCREAVTPKPQPATTPKPLPATTPKPQTSKPAPATRPKGYCDRNESAKKWKCSGLSCKQSSECATANCVPVFFSKKCC